MLASLIGVISDIGFVCEHLAAILVNDHNFLVSGMVACCECIGDSAL